MSIRVLIAEDFPLVADGIAAALERDPQIAIVGIAGDGREALRRAQELVPDVMLVDLHMPELGGMMVLERLRIEQPGVRAIVVTASEKSDPLLDAVAAGAAGYLRSAPAASPTTSARATTTSRSRSTTSTRCWRGWRPPGSSRRSRPTRPAGATRRICFVADPDGYRVELVDGEFPTQQDPPHPSLAGRA